MKVKALVDAIVTYQSDHEKAKGPFPNAWLGLVQVATCSEYAEIDLPRDKSLGVAFVVDLKDRGPHLVELDARLVKNEDGYGYEGTALPTAGYGSQMRSARRRFWIAVQEYLNDLAENPPWEVGQMVRWLEKRQVKMQALRDKAYYVKQTLPLEEVSTIA